MGGGIVQVCAQSGYEVTVLEINNELLNKGLDAIKSALSKNMSKGQLSQEDCEAVIGRIKGTTEARDFGHCDLVIEASSENMDLKKRLFAEVDRVCPEHTILATNTSCLSVIEIAMATSRPEKVISLHFMNPAPVMKLLEVVRTVATSDATMEISRRFGEEAGLATKEDIDIGVSLGLGHPMGPLRLADLIGLDIVLQVTEYIYDELKDPRYIPPILLKKMISAGWLGRKTGRGFYEYPR
jgi:3-hydroxybutyryl-CoA dehydrogenase